MDRKIIGLIYLWMVGWIDKWIMDIFIVRMIDRQINEKLDG